MSLPQYEQVLDFLQRSRMNEVRLLGGEPTLHPHFPQMIQMARERDLSLLIFTGGLIPNRALDALEQIDRSALRLLLNVLHPHQGRPSERARQQTVLERLGECTTLGITIAEPGVELDFALNLIREYGLQRRVRLGLAHPDPRSRNHFLHPNYYPEVGLRAAHFAVKAREQGVSLDFDCGWVPCMFPDGALEHLEIGGHQVGVTCSPILDILANGKTISCYALAHLTARRLPKHRTATWLRSRFEADQSLHRLVTIYNHCSSCRWHESGSCRGGCLGASMRRYRHTSFSFELTGASATAAQAAVFSRRHPHESS